MIMNSVNSKHANYGLNLNSSMSSSANRSLKMRAKPMNGQYYPHVSHKSAGAKQHQNGFVSPSPKSPSYHQHATMSLPSTPCSGSASDSQSDNNGTLFPMENGHHVNGFAKDSVENFEVTLKFDSQGGRRASNYTLEHLQSIEVLRYVIDFECLMYILRVFCPIPEVFAAYIVIRSLTGFSVLDNYLVISLDI